MAPVRNSNLYLELLSQLTIGEWGDRSDSSKATDLASRLTAHDLETLKTLADRNHVLVRAFGPLHNIFAARRDSEKSEWVSQVLSGEQSRITTALRFLEEICAELAANRSPAIVIKSLDHWPDLGSDLDLFSDMPSDELVRVMKLRFNADPAERSWGDRLANKWNFVVPRLPELVEVHVGRLGQTGEQTAVTRSLSDRAQMREVGGHEFRVAAPEERIIISTLQRMYRHFYIRLCDVVDNARLVDSGVVDFDYLRALGEAAGLWDGISTYLRIVSEYVSFYRGYGLDLPPQLVEGSRFGATQVHFRRDFLRVPILPQSLNLYATELKTLLLRGEVRNTLRLSLLPGLATAAAIEQKITGSDKGIW